MQKSQSDYFVLCSNKLTSFECVYVCVRVCMLVVARAFWVSAKYNTAVVQCLWQKETRTQSTESESLDALSETTCNSTTEWPTNQV